MERKTTNYKRFYAVFNRLPGRGDDEELKRNLVIQYSGGRTDTLKELSTKEYTALCMALEAQTGRRDEIKRRRSIVLKLMQEVGVDTTDWAQINDFSRHPKIAGKEFGRLSIEELKTLARKLRSIKRKGWQRRKEPDRKTEVNEQAMETTKTTYYIPLGAISGTNGNYNA